MVYKFVRVDCVESYKIDLPTGKHTIGRGKFLLEQVVDKNVSREHAELQVTDEDVTVRSLNQNPCFFKRKGENKKEILQQNNTVSLCNGDRFGVLPENYWFELLLISNTEDGPQNQATTKDNTANASVGTDSINRINVKNEPNGHSNDTVLNTRGQDSILPSENLTQRHDHALASTSNDSLTTPTKRPHCPQDASVNDGTKKVKTHPANNYKESPPIEDFAELLNSIANDFKAVANSGSEKKQGSPTNDGPSRQAPTRAKPPDAPLRERCMYGTKCYRRNAAHRAEYSHPGDADWAAEERGACAAGATCGRRLAAHWRHYRHPPAARAPANTPGAHVVRKNGNIYYINAHTVNINNGEVELDDDRDNGEENEEDIEGDSEEYSD